MVGRRLLHLSTLKQLHISHLAPWFGQKRGSSSLALPVPRGIEGEDIWRQGFQQTSVLLKGWSRWTPGRSRDDVFWTYRLSGLSVLYSSPNGGKTTLSRYTIQIIGSKDAASSSWHCYY